MHEGAVCGRCLGQKGRGVGVWSQLWDRSWYFVCFETAAAAAEIFQCPMKTPNCLESCFFFIVIVLERDFLDGDRCGHSLCLVCFLRCSGGCRMEAVRVFSVPFLL